MKPVPWSAVMLSIGVIVAAAAASLLTLVWPGSFPDPSLASVGDSVLAEARGWSAATLPVAIPLAIISLRAACRGSLRGRLVWLGGSRTSFTPTSSSPSARPLLRFIFCTSQRLLVRSPRW